MKNRIIHNFLELFSPVDLVTILYVLISGIYISFSTLSFTDLLPHFFFRILILALIVSLSFLHRRVGANQLLLSLRNFYPLLFLGFFYTETSCIKNILFENNLDNYFINAEQSLWGCQPSMTFSKHMNQEWFNEVMNMCYFSYYILITLVCFALYFKKPEHSEKGIFIITFSFYLYYIIFAILPVVGPQFYVQDPTAEAIPTHFFGNIMHTIFTTYEKPTGAFPSSHVGIAIIISYLTFLYLKKLFFITLPFVLGICFATVYIKAHYLVDVIGGLISAPLFIFVSIKVYTKILDYTKQFKKQKEALTFV